MTARQISRIAILASILMVSFRLFSDILYLEIISLVIVCFACVFQRTEVVYASIVFAMLNFLVQGIAPWSIMYLLLYPCAGFLVSLLKQPIAKTRFRTALAVALLSFSTGQILQLPWIFVSEKVTIIYLIMGLKTSLIQGTMSFAVAYLLSTPLLSALRKIEKIH